MVAILVALSEEGEGVGQFEPSKCVGSYLTPRARRCILWARRCTMVRLAMMAWPSTWSLKDQVEGQAIIPTGRRVVFSGRAVMHKWFIYIIRTRQYVSCKSYRLAVRYGCTVEGRDANSDSWSVWMVLAALLTEPAVGWNGRQEHMGSKWEEENKGNKILYE